ncbi:MAG: ABC transporter permease [Fimbriimonadaceae bacterium]|nr:ABC transporter permease [Fimbriimonadaceae bacterium]
MLNELKELWKYRELLFSMVERELKIRYKNSVIGFFWSLLNPLITIFVLWFVSRNFMGFKTDNLSAYLLAGYLPFLFFQMSVLDSSQSVIVSLQLIKKIYFPREILPLAAVIGNFIHFLLALVVFFGFLLAVWIFNPGQVPFQLTTLYLPILLVVNFALATGVAFIVSALNTFYEDVKYIVSVLMYLMFFLCPVMYFSETVWEASQNSTNPGLMYNIYHLNPVAALSTAYRKVLVAPQDVVTGRGEAEKIIPALPLDWGQIGVAAAISFGLLVYGYWLFNRMKWRFVERP